MKPNNSYEAKDIEVLEGLEPVRKRPGCILEELTIKLYIILH